MKQAIALLVLCSACRREPQPLIELAAHLPTNSSMLAGLDVDRLRDTPLFAKLPESFREASYVLAAYDPPNLVTASRVGGKIIATSKPGAPPDLIRHAAAAPIWIVARGDTPLPLTGNLANINRLLQQTLYTRVTARIESRVEFEAGGIL